MLCSGKERRMLFYGDKETGESLNAGSLIVKVNFD